MRRLLVLLALTGCKKPVDAPDRIEELMVFGLVHFDDPGHLEATVESLFAWAEDHGPELAEGYFVDSLGNEDLETMGVEDPDVKGVLGAVGAATYRIPPDCVAMGVTSPDKEDIYEATEVWDVLWSEDRPCFLRHDCEAYAFEAYEENRLPVIGVTRREVTSEQRWVASEEGPILAIRQRTPEPFEIDSPFFAIDQQYAFAMVRPEGEGAFRVEAIWVDAKILGAEVPEGSAVRQAVQGMQKAADDMDAWYLGD